jgi:steroid delta-isomerase-like uncharacterized protein
MRRLAAPISIIALTVVLLSRAVVVAHEATPAPVPEPLTALATAWEAGDLESILAAYTEDATYENVPFGVVIHGKEELRAYLEEQFAAFPDLSVVPTRAFIADDWATLEWTVTGTYTGQLPGLPPGAGQSITFRSVAIVELEGDKVRAHREYPDAYGFLRQIGAPPVPEVAGTPAP